MKSSRTPIASVAACLLEVSCIPFAMAQVKAQMKAAAAPQGVVLVELFTSEGCSSCPPADELLRKVNGMQTPGGDLIVGISEHVTYWNQLGWADPFSSSTYTDRQERYVRQFSLDSVYTPQMIVNGTQQFVGSNAFLLGQAIGSQSTRKTIALRVLSADVHNSTITIHFAATQLLSTHPVEIVAVLTEDLTSSKVLRGENGGRSLQHVAVARSLAKVATIHGDTDMTVEIPLGQSSGMKNNAGQHLLLFAQNAAQGSIVGTVAIPLVLDGAR